MLVERLRPFGLVALLLVGGLATGSTAASADAAKSLQEALEPDGLYAVIETTLGTLVCRLEFERTPVTVGSFVGLAEGRIPFRDPSSQQLVTRPFYNGLKFHRVVRDFVIQGGDPLGDGTGGPGYVFIDEFDTELRHDVPGILSMANSGPGTNGSQFFITLKELPHLDDRHTVFGRLVFGFDVLQTISTQVVDRKTGTPFGDIIMSKVEIVRRGAQAEAFDAVAAFELQDEIEAQREMERSAQAARFQAKLAAEFRGCEHAPESVEESIDWNADVGSQLAKKTRGTSKEEPATEAKDATDAVAEAVLGESCTQLESGVRYVVRAAGSGMPATSGDMVTAHYVGFLEDGTKFDSSYDRNVPFRFPLGQGRVIRAWDEVFVAMRRGEKRRIVVPPALGYGERGHKRFGIPPNATLIFDIEVVEILRP